MISKLNYFLHKPCTIITSPINRNFTEQQALDYFTGFVESIDSVGIMMRQLSGPQKTYIFINNIVSIAEEAIELLPESKSEILPSAEPVIDKSVVQKQTKPDKYINADALMSLSQQMKQNKNI
jgi:hypothetical protein